MRWFVLVLALGLGLAVLAGAPARAAAGVPPGYDGERDGETLRYRPTGERDADVEIRVYGAAPGSKGAVAFLEEWMTAHPPPGPMVGKPTPLNEPSAGIAVSGRVFSRGSRTIQEAILAVRTPAGTFQVEVTRLPADRSELANRHMQAAASIAKDLARGEASAPAAAPAPAVDARGTAGSIATVGFYTKARVGIGGSLTFEPTPIVLFKSGEAVDDMAALAAPGGLAAHRAEHPASWTRWRRNDGRLEIERKGEWKKLDFQKTMDALPDGFRLHGEFQRLSGTGNTAVGGTSSIAAWSTLSFDRSGTFTTSHGAHATSESRTGDERTQVSAYGQSPDDSGRYQISGYVLILRYASGRVEQRLIVTEASDPSSIWLDGLGYARR